jgi:hypothetical protein
MRLVVVAPRVFRVRWSCGSAAIVFRGRHHNDDAASKSFSAFRTFERQQL